MAGVTALLGGPAIYGIFQATQGTHELFFLHQVFFTFVILVVIMVAMTVVCPLAEPRKLPVREDIALETEPIVKIAGALVIAGVIAFFIIFR